MMLGNSKHPKEETLVMTVARKRNAILFVGLNPEAPHEAQELRRSGSQVLFVGNSKTADCVVLNGRSFDLSTPDGRGALLGVMKLSTSQQNIITPVVANAYGNSRDELGKLELVWASAEHGGTPCRLEW
jgi:hypothetical protein